MNLFSLELIISAGILLAAAGFQFYQLGTTPEWFIDEGEFTRLPENISRGNYNFLVIPNSLLLIGRPPLFLYALAALFKLFGVNIFTLRLFISNLRQIFDRTMPDHGISGTEGKTVF